MLKSARRVTLLLSGLLLTATSASAQHTYYISKSLGSDSNSATQAQSKTTPWAHLPGMTTCSSNCGSYAPVAGDTFILKGCDVWVNSDLPVTWNWSGSSGSPITITVDKTWYNTSTCPSAWNRPVFDEQKQNLVGTALGNDLFVASFANPESYVTLDNIEMKGLYCSGACSYGQVDYIAVLDTATDWTLSNLYLHGWNVVTDGNCIIVQFQANVSSANNLLETSIIDGSDATGASPAGATCYATYPGLVNIENNVIHDLANGIVGYSTDGAAKTVSGNLIYNIKESNAGSHPNAIEFVGGGTYYVHDNVIHDSLGESLMFGNTGEVDYIWNNLWYNVLGNAPEAPQNSGQTGMTFSAWNNTVVPPSGATCLNWNSGDGGTFTAVTIKNNHCISTGSVATTSWNGTSATLTTNLLMSPTAATSQGYTSSETFAYSPTLGTNGTVVAGTNLASLCSGLLSGLCNDTAYAVSYNSTMHTVIVPGMGQITRPTSWDVGAYQYAGGTAPAAPTNLVATAR